MHMYHVRGSNTPSPPTASSLMSTSVLNQRNQGPIQLNPSDGFKALHSDAVGSSRGMGSSLGGWWSLSRPLGHEASPPINWPLETEWVFSWSWKHPAPSTPRRDNEQRRLAGRGGIGRPPPEMSPLRPGSQRPQIPDGRWCGVTQEGGRRESGKPNVGGAGTFLATMSLKSRCQSKGGKYQTTQRSPFGVGETEQHCRSGWRDGRMDEGKKGRRGKWYRGRGTDGLQMRRMSDAGSARGQIRCKRCVLWSPGVAQEQIVWTKAKTPRRSGCAVLGRPEAAGTVPTGGVWMRAKGDDRGWKERLRGANGGPSSGIGIGGVRVAVLAAIQSIIIMLSWLAHRSLLVQPATRLADRPEAGTS
ncbi:hypothetical protein EDB81DRAFT_762425 [Dactylonectria macrodidyma]|uniref:Uncharacterized protein n=1 Tax=Dactylonectria macrodidyma TaxID=307937 RepID=A0A9P9EAV5_9HYPO|nr:hypothetical protein EDB81DRAFT_762425 [Dactylonectria macrodidyma]